ncbi:hypothetical protein VPH35_051074 [Triticum aestivum]
MGGCGAGGPICAARTRPTRGTLDPVTHQSPVVGPANRRRRSHHPAPSFCLSSSFLCAPELLDVCCLGGLALAARPEPHGHPVVVALAAPSAPPPQLRTHVISVPTPCYQRKPQASFSG